MLRSLSLPLRECGLKCTCILHHALIRAVTPLAGVWIEMQLLHFQIHRLHVTPLAGVWIEILLTGEKGMKEYSHSPCGSVD